jgi:hypothetical protein
MASIESLSYFRGQKARKFPFAAYVRAKSVENRKKESAENARRRRQFARFVRRHKEHTREGLFSLQINTTCAEISHTQKNQLSLLEWIFFCRCEVLSVRGFQWRQEDIVVGTFI